MQPFVGHTKAVRCVAFTPDGGTLVSGDDDGEVIAWDRTGLPRFRVRASHDPVLAVACHPSGDRLAAPYRPSVTIRHTLTIRDGPDRVRFWATDTGRPTEAFDGDTSMWHRAELFAAGRTMEELSIPGCDSIESIHYLPDGESVAVLFASPPTPYSFEVPTSARLWRLGPRPAAVPSWLDRRARVTALALSADGATAAVASREYVRAGRLDAKAVPPGYAAKGVVKSIALSPNGGRLAGCWGDRVTVWETAGGEVRDFAGHAAPVEAVAYRPDGAVVASAGLDGRVLLWEPGGGAARAAYDWNLGPVHALAFSPDCLTLAVAGQGGLVLIDLD